MDPAMHWEIYRPQKMEGACRIAVLTSSYESWGKTNYGEDPKVRITADSGEEWEFVLAGRDPRTWELWRVTPGKDSKKVPFILGSKISRWGNPEPPWEPQKTQSTQPILPATGSGIQSLLRTHGVRIQGSTSSPCEVLNGGLRIIKFSFDEGGFRSENMAHGIIRRCALMSASVGAR